MDKAGTQPLTASHTHLELVQEPVAVEELVGEASEGCVGARLLQLPHVEVPLVHALRGRTRAKCVGCIPLKVL